jgi:heat shock protein HslJ
MINNETIRHPRRDGYGEMSAIIPTLEFMKTNVILFICLFYVGGIGCKTPTQTMIKTNESIYGSFTLVQQKDEHELINIGFKESIINIVDSTERINCFVGCNSISGNFNVENGYIKPIKWERTEKACKDYLDGLEERFVYNLGHIDNYKWNGLLLELYEKENLLLVLKKKK